MGMGFMLGERLKKSLIAIPNSTEQNKRRKILMNAFSGVNLKILDGWLNKVFKQFDFDAVRTQAWRVMTDQNDGTTRSQP